jgi:DNA polymerase-3 subunit delta
MIEKKTGTSYQTIMRDLKSHKFSPIYILMGDESFYIDKISDYIADSVLQPEDRDFNQNVLFGADTSAVQIVDLCKGYPMMAEHRVVIVKEAQNLRNLDAIDRYLEKVVNSTILVLCYKN